MKFQDYVLSFFVGVVLVLFILTITQGREIQLQQEQLEHQEEVTQNLRNDLVDTQYYYDEQIYRLKAQLTAYDDVLQDILSYEERYSELEYEIKVQDEMIERLEYEIKVQDEMIRIIIWETDDTYTYEDYREIAKMNIYFRELE